MFGHGGWMMNSWGMGGGSWFHILVLVGLFLLVAWIVRTIIAGTGTKAGSTTAREILDLRYARGEITRKEYEQIKKDINA
jgi:putative membrane protein